MQKQKIISLLRFSLTILFSASVVIASAQPMQQFLYTHLGTRNGLASEETMGVQQDQTGYIWIATMDGLQRYDGKRLLTFRNGIGNPRTIPNDMVRQLQIDKKNRLWLRCSENKVGWFNVSDFTFHEASIRFPKELAGKAEGRLFSDFNGNIILVLAGTGVLTYREDVNEFSEQYNPFGLPAGWKANWVAQDPLQQDYWIACDSGLVKFNPLKNTLSYRGHNTDQDKVIAAYAHLRWVNTPYFDKSGRCWLLSWPTKEQTYFYSYDLVSGKIKEWEIQFNRLTGNAYYYIQTLKEQRDGTLWVIGGNLFARLNKAGTAFEMVPNNLPGEFSIRYDVMEQLYEDRENNLWVSTNNGLFRFNPSSQFFHAIVNKKIFKDSIYNSDVTDILQIKNGDILVSTWGNGIFPYDKNFNPVNAGYINQSRWLGENLTWCILQRSNGDIWSGNQYGTIYITDAASKRTEKIQPPVFEARTIRQIAEDKKGDIWLATMNGDLVKWTAATGHFALIKKLNTAIERLYADANDNIWVCTRGSGLYKLKRSDGSVIDHYTADGPAEKKLMKTYAMDIIEYNDSLFIIASGGLNILNTRINTIRHLIEGNNYPVNNISNIIKDRMGKIWATTLSGLCSVDMEKELTITYDHRDGVHTNSFNGASTAMLNDGRIAIGTSHDLLVFDPQEVNNAPLPLPDIIITRFALLNKGLLMDSINKLKTVELPYDKNSLAIEFSTLTYQNNFGISYMLDGLDKDWRFDFGSNQAIYTYLPPGIYTFRVKVENGDQLGSVKYTSLKIKIKAPFWKTWWFVSLLAFAAIGILYWIDKFRVERIRDTERVRTRIATSLTKDMSNTLGNINVLSELANIKLDKDIERTREYIGQISENSGRMIEVMDDMIWSINPENDELQYTILRMKKYAAQIQLKYGLEISFAIDEKVKEIKLHMDRRHELFLIYKEALLNAGKHAGGKFADVEITLEKAKIKLKIADNGRGFNIADASFGRGFIEMRKKAGALNATLDISSVINSGTTVILVMPV